MKYKLINLNEATPSEIELMKQAENQCIEFGYDWFCNLAANASPPPEENKLLCIQEDNSKKTTLILPIKINKKNKTVNSLSNFYTSLFTPISLAEHPNESLFFAFSKLREERWSRILLSPLSREDSLFEDTIKGLDSSGWISFPYFCFGNWYIPNAPSSFTDYFKTLPSQIQNTIRRKRKKFLTQNQGRLELITKTDNIDAAINAWVQIYNASWKSPEPYGDFMPALIKLCASKGWMRLGIAYLDDNPIAAQFWIVHQERAEIYKLAYDQSQSKHGAGTILTAFLMEHVINHDHVTEIDYLIGDDSYKSDWMTHRRERWGIISYNPSTVKGRLMLTLERAMRFIKKITSKSIHKSSPP
jgi:hypothetical protein